MSLLADSPKSSCNNSVSSVTSAGSPAPPVSITGQTSAMSRGPLVQKSGTALSGLTPATATAATFENVGIVNQTFVSDFYRLYLRQL